MKHSNNIIVSCSLLVSMIFLILMGDIHGQDIPKFLPGVSTCRQIEREYKITACGKGSVVVERKNSVSIFYFSAGPCDTLSPYGKYNLPPDTLSAVEVLLRASKPIHISQLGYSLADFEKEPEGDHLNYFKFSNPRMGIRFVGLENGVVDNLVLFPKEGNVDVACPKNPPSREK